MPEQYVVSKVLTAVVMNSSVFWDETQCKFIESQPMFQNMSPPSSELKKKPSKKPA
jgi:hypothetical protein